MWVRGSECPAIAIACSTSTPATRDYPCAADRYPNTAISDVVNGPPPHTYPSHADAIGGGTNGSWQWIIKAFVWADEYCPNAILLLNDYNIIEWSGDTNRFISIAQTLQNAGAPIDCTTQTANAQALRDRQVGIGSTCE